MNSVEYDYHNIGCPNCGSSKFQPAEPFLNDVEIIKVACLECGKIFDIVKMTYDIRANCFTRRICYEQR